MNFLPLALIPLSLLLAGCVATAPPPLPDAAAFARPTDGFLGVTSMTVDVTRGSAWGWRIRVPEGTWKLVCRYEDWAEGDQFSADVTFPDGTKRTLPNEAVSVACRAISREPELEAWKDDRGRVLLRLSGLITASSSEGVFAFDGLRLDGWWCRSMIDPSPRTGKREIEYERVFDGAGRQIAP